MVDLIYVGLTNEGCNMNGKSVNTSFSIWNNTHSKNVLLNRLISGNGKPYGSDGNGNAVSDCSKIINCKSVHGKNSNNSIMIIDLGLSALV